ncbi:glycosyltransferase [Nonlabens xiamenensis]|uniref:glycosyltransferase n=1 Tax=Nonlabens xiamenensis TaxID=2341043 RepID=UPI000F609569|nr:glycosyltransferase [Nonlabens xiamenensis]
MGKKAKCIIVLHKSGADSHYRGLQCLADARGIQLKYREFSVASRLFKSIVKLDGQLFVKQWKNLFTLIELRCTRNYVVVLGIAPYDRTLKRLRSIIKRHRIYYHTSWPVWDGDYFPKKKGVNSNVKAIWKNFIELQVSAVFTVTQQAKTSLLKHYVMTADVHVVGHAYDPEDFHYDPLQASERNGCLYVGRLVAQKGITELLDFFKKYPAQRLTLIGDGPLVTVVQEAADNFPNIQFFPATKHNSDLNRLFNEHTYLLLNSQRSSKWQELFGMVLIEAMATGCIPIATAHIGPQEIIEHNKNGYLFSETTFMDELSLIIQGYPNEAMIQDAMKRAAYFEIDNIAERWVPLLNTDS